MLHEVLRRDQWSGNGCPVGTPYLWRQACDSAPQPRQPGPQLCVQGGMVHCMCYAPYHHISPQSFDSFHNPGPGMETLTTHTQGQEGYKWRCK